MGEHTKLHYKDKNKNIMDMGPNHIFFFFFIRPIKVGGRVELDLKKTSKPCGNRSCLIPIKNKGEQANLDFGHLSRLFTSRTESGLVRITD